MNKSGKGFPKKIWGRLVWRGNPQIKDKVIGCRTKKQWSIVGTPDYTHFKATPDQIPGLIPMRKDPWPFVPPELREENLSADVEDAPEVATGVAAEKATEKAEDNTTEEKGQI